MKAEDEEFDFEVRDELRRIDVNRFIKHSLDYFINEANEATGHTKYMGRVNYNLGDMSISQAVEWLNATINSCQELKRAWGRVEGLTRDIINNLDWYIRKCHKDLLRYREKLNAEENENSS